MSAPVQWRRLSSPYRAYEVSSDGRIRRGSRELRLTRDRDGYGRVGLYYAGLRKHSKIHRLVCEAFHGPAPEGTECGHLNGNPRDNRATNLKWITRAENIEHMFLHGTRLRAGTCVRAKRPPAKRKPIDRARAYWTKISDETVSEIRRLRAEGRSGNSLSKQFGVCKRSVQRILRGESRFGQSSQQAVSTKGFNRLAGDAK